MDNASCQCSAMTPRQAPSPRRPGPSPTVWDSFSSGSKGLLREHQQIKDSKLTGDGMYAATTGGEETAEQHESTSIGTARTGSKKE